MAYTSKFSGVEIDTKLDDLTTITSNLDAVNSNTAAYVTSFTTTTSDSATWYIKKYNTGIAEAYGIIDVGQIGCNQKVTATGWWWYNDKGNGNSGYEPADFNLPSGLFSGAPVVSVTVSEVNQNTGEGGYSYLFSLTNTSSTKIFGFWWCQYGNTSGTEKHNLKLHIHAVGPISTS